MARTSILPLTLAWSLASGLTFGQAQESADPTPQAPRPFSVVFLNGKSAPVAALTLQGENFVVNTTTTDFNQGQVLPANTASHIDGERPQALNQAIALLLSNKARDARDLLEPIHASQVITAKIPGNFWVEATRVLMLSHAVSGDPKKSTELGKLVAEATPQQGVDPFTNLGKALAMSPASSTLEDRVSAIRMVLTDDQPASVQAYASFFLGQLYLKERKPADALQAFFSVTNLYPTGGLVVCAAAELQAAELLSAQKLNSEALALVQSAQLSAANTVIAQDAAKRMESLK